MMTAFTRPNNLRDWDGAGGVQNYNTKYFLENLSLNGHTLRTRGGRITLKSAINSSYILFK